MSWRYLPLALLIVPIVEIAVIIQVGHLIGFWPTFLLLVAESALGAWLVKREGLRAWRALSEAIRTGHLPSRELTDAGLVLVGGTLLLTPGFVTDVVGFFFVLPPTRPLARRLVQAWVARRGVAVVTRRASRVNPGGVGPGGANRGGVNTGGVNPGGDVIDEHGRPV
ncbi:MAG: FxsA family protein [Nocardioidaceae bacterium]